MFRQKPAYTPAELHGMVSQIKELNQLRDQSMQKARLYTNDDRSIYSAEVDRYSIEIKTAQLVYQKMLEKVDRQA